MRMPIGNLQAVVLEFVQQVLIPAAETKGGMLPFSVGIVGGLVANKTVLTLTCFMRRYRRISKRIRSILGRISPTKLTWISCGKS